MVARIDPSFPAELAPGISPELAQAILEAPVLREIHGNRRGVVVEVTVDGDRYARKHYRARGLLRSRAIAPARRSWELISRRQLPLPEAVCFTTEGPDAAVLVTRWFDGDQIHLAHAAARDELRDLGALEEFLRSIADTLVELWNAGLSTTDLAPQNVLVGRSAAGWRAILVDLDDVRIVDRISTAQVRENLAQLGHLPPSISSTTRLRFWRYFLAAGGGALLQGNRGTLEPRRRLAEIADRITRLAREKSHRLNARGLLEHRFSGWGLDAEGRPLR